MNYTLVAWHIAYTGGLRAKDRQERALIGTGGHLDYRGFIFTERAEGDFTLILDGRS